MSVHRANAVVCRYATLVDLDGKRCEWLGLLELSMEIPCADLLSGEEAKDHRPDLQCIKDACKNHPDLLCVIEAMQICCRAQKCRASDEAAIWYRENPTYKPPTPEETTALNRDNLPKPVIDDKVIDQHTANGRRRKRGMDHFKQVASPKLT